MEDDSSDDNDSSAIPSSTCEGGEETNTSDSGRKDDGADEDKASPALATTSGTKRKKPMTLSSNSERWEEMFERLKKFKEKHNHCSVPNRFPEDPSLGCWVSTQRRHFKKAQQRPGEGLTPERTARLAELGFEWTGENPRHRNWDIRFEELKEFKAKYGHAQVPIGFEDNVQLANWTSTQRQEYKNLLKGRPSRLNDQRIKQLNEIGFAWELQRGGRRRRVTVVRDSTHAMDIGDTDSGAASKALPQQDASGKSPAKGQARSTSVVLPGVAILGGDVEQAKIPAARSQKSTSKAKQASPSKHRAQRQERVSESVIAPQLKQPPPSSVPSVPPNISSSGHHTAANNSRQQSNSMAIQQQFVNSGGVQSMNGGMFGQATNALQALARAQLLSGGVGHASAVSNLTSYQQALAALTNQRGGTGLNLTGTTLAPTLSLRTLQPSSANFYSLLAQQSNQNNRLRHQLGLSGEQPNLASGLTNSLFLQAAAALLQQQSPLTAATIPANQARDDPQSLRSSRLDGTGIDPNRRSDATLEDGRQEQQELRSSRRDEGPPNPPTR